MAVTILKIMTDIFWYLAVVMPLAGGGPAIIKAVLFAVPCIYGGWILVSGKNRDFSGGCQDTFLFEGKVLAGIGIPELVIIGLDTWQRQCGPFVLGFLLSGILLLRISRVSRSEQDQVRFWGLNGLSLLPVLAAAVVLASKTVRGQAAALLGGVYRTLILPVILGVLQLFLMGLQAIAPLFSFIFPGLVNISSDMGTVVLDTDTKVDFGDSSPVEIPPLFKVIGVLIIVTAAAALLYVIYRRITGAGRYEMRRSQAEVYRSAFSPEERREQGGGILNREKNVRHYYRKFLQLCRSRGMQIGVSETSTEIEKRAAGCWPEQELSEFGDLYRQVRYGNGKDGKEERQRAREIYKKFKDVK